MLNIEIYYDNKEHLCNCLSQFQVCQAVQIKYLSLSWQWWTYMWLPIMILYVLNCLCWDILSPTFGCFIIVITKVHTGIVIVLSMIIILGRMLRLVKEINYILWTVLIFFCSFGNKISAFWLWYLISCPYRYGISKFQAIDKLRNFGN